MATSPIEFRHYLKLATIEDIAQGMQPLRQQTARGLELFAPPVLQFRFKVRGPVLQEGGAVESGMVWSDWQEIRWVREGDPTEH